MALAAGKGRPAGEAPWGAGHRRGVPCGAVGSPNPKGPLQGPPSGNGEGGPFRRARAKARQNVKIMFMPPTLSPPFPEESP